MSAAQPALPYTQEEADALSERGLAIYENTLKSLLEPVHNTKFVSIHVESEDYVLGASSGDALRAMRKRHPHGWLVMLKIGDEPEWGLAARILVGKMAMGQQK